MAQINKHIQYNKFKNEWKIYFDQSSESIRESILVNNTLLSFESIKLNDNQIFSIFEIIFRNIKQYNITQDSEEPDNLIFRKYFNLIHSKNKSSYGLILPEMTYSFYNSAYQINITGFEQIFNFNDSSSYWSYNFTIDSNLGQYNSRRFTVYKKFSTFNGKDMYFLKIIKLSKGIELKTLFSDALNSFDDILKKIEKESSEILMSRFKKNITPYVNDSSTVNDSNIESIKELVKLSIY
jgi:hypothetical protein